MAALGQTIAVIDKSGKVVSTSKHLFGVFKEARSAYRERKAEIRAERRAKQLEREAAEAQRALAAYTLEDSRSVSSSRRHVSRSRSVVRQGDYESHHHRHHRSHRHRYDDDLRSTTSSRYPHQELARRHTSHDVALDPPELVPPKSRSYSAPHIDMDLAYGEFHPSSLERIKSASEDNEEDLKGLVGKVRMILDEADCAQHSATAIIQHLQQKPDAMAAVALTLAEISNLVAKMAPSALSALKASAPAVWALLASPQFMIAAGVGLGVTVVMFGGYKIIKQIKAANEGGIDLQEQPQQPYQQPYQHQHQPFYEAAYAYHEPTMEEMVELNSKISRIENWRRGVADWEAESVGTSVDGEFITPTAAAMSGINLPLRVNELRAEEGGSVRDGESEYSRHSRSSRRSRSSRHSGASSDGSSREKKKKRKEKKDKKDKKDKKPSPLRKLFKN
ncbi:hypothetical protein VTO42DRAFT_298 [Malbranchea cinnamomea]